MPVEGSNYRSEQAINNVLEVKSFVSAVPGLHEALTGARAPLLSMVRSLCRPEAVKPLLDLINEVINDDVTYMKGKLDLRNQRTYAVKVSIFARG